MYSSFAFREAQFGGTMGVEDLEDLIELGTGIPTELWVWLFLELLADDDGKAYAHQLMMHYVDGNGDRFTRTEGDRPKWGPFMRARPAIRNAELAFYEAKTRELCGDCTPGKGTFKEKLRREPGDPPLPPGVDDAIRLNDLDSMLLTLNGAHQVDVEGRWTKTRLEGDRCRIDYVNDWNWVDRGDLHSQLATRLSSGVTITDDQFRAIGTVLGADEYDIKISWKVKTSWICECAGDHRAFPVRLSEMGRRLLDGSFVSVDQVLEIAAFRRSLRPATSRSLEDEPPERLNGVGPKLSERLSAAQITTIAALRRLEGPELSKILDVSIGRAELILTAAHGFILDRQPGGLVLAATGPAGGHLPVDKINGVGRTYARRLREAQKLVVDDVRPMNEADLAAILKVGIAKAQIILAAARLPVFDKPRRPSTRSLVDA